MAKKLTLGKDERLKSRKQTELLFNTGKKFNFPPFRIHYLLSKDDTALLHHAAIGFGIGVSSKVFKKAVDRNRIKRLTREAWRLQKSGLQQQLKEQNARLHIFFIYTGKELPVYQEVYDKTGKVLDKLCKLFTEIN